MLTALLFLLPASTSPLLAEPARPGLDHPARVALGSHTPLSPTTGGGTIAASIAESWTPITALPFTITTSGGYYLAGNLTGAPGSHGITVAINDVVIDLNGFRLSGVTGSLDGIHANPAVGRVRVRNGFVTSWGQDGIDMQTAAQTVSEGVLVLGNGGNGLFCGAQGRIVDCTAIANGSVGFMTALECTVERCTSSQNKDDGFTLGQRALISECLATGNNGDGIFGNEVLVRGCQALSNDGHGIFVLVNAQVFTCTADQNRGDGIRIGPNCVARENTCNQNGLASADGAGIRSTASGCRIESNHVVGNDRGIEATNGNCLIVRNSALANGTNYAIANGNSVGPILEPSQVATNENPNANYSL